MRQQRLALIASSRVVAAIVRVPKWRPLDNGLLAPDSLHLGLGRINLDSLPTDVPERYDISGTIWFQWDNVETVTSRLSP